MGGLDGRSFTSVRATKGQRAVATQAADASLGVSAAHPGVQNARVRDARARVHRPIEGTIVILLTA